ncbi:hypothetical protein HPB52_005716 [Rhipicephalus sanguineus]|uniref:PAP-associated domain-containing protein n=1 Tax=Rhipicephalus sanguineus TaxID=34632 RepID=A0A9D4PC16_RHISA|nr:hypothetical protein HPB52_005716 [Rhipicephalus sanguineus]
MTSQSAHIQVLSGVCTNVMNICKSVPRDQNLREKIRREVESHIRKTHADAEVTLYGSSSNGFGLRGSDVDMSVTFEDDEDGKQCQPPVIPVLQEQSVWSGFGQNEKTVGELWLGLLRFYTEEFNFKDHVVSIRQKALLTRSQKGWQSEYIAIEDPFIKERDVGKSVTNMPHLTKVGPRNFEFRPREPNRPNLDPETEAEKQQDRENLDPQRPGQPQKGAAHHKRLRAGAQLPRQNRNHARGDQRNESPLQRVQHQLQQLQLQQPQLKEEQAQHQQQRAQRHQKERAPAEAIGSIVMASKPTTSTKSRGAATFQQLPRTKVVPQPPAAAPAGHASATITAAAAAISLWTPFGAAIQCDA